MGADGRYGVGMRWLVLTRPEPCAGAFQCGTRHPGSNVLSALKPGGVRRAQPARAARAGAWGTRGSPPSLFREG